MRAGVNGAGLDKVRPLAELAELLAVERAAGRTLVHCHGVFDLLHPGHIRHLEAARSHGDVLVVTVTPDRFVQKGPARPVFNERLRAESVAALGCVDYVAVNEWPTAVEAIRMFQPRFYVKGTDYEDPDRDVTGAIGDEEAAVRACGGALTFTREIAFSSTELLNQFYNVYPAEARQFLDGFKRRHTADTIIRSIQGLSDLRALVIGESIVDEYHYCQPVGKSPKESIVSTRYVRQESFGGGAIACANHLAGFCGRVDLITCLGRDDPRDSFIRGCLRPNVTPTFFYRSGASTIIKRRYVWEPFLIKMFEVSFMDDSEIAPDAEAEIRAHLEAVLSSYDLVLVADYGHGLLGPTLVSTLCEQARFLAVNTQANSANLGFNLITKYPRADYVCIDEPEIRLAFHDRHSPVLELGRAVKERLGARAVVVTRGHRGSLALDGNDVAWDIPIFSSEVVDRVGAGDAYLSVSAPCVAAGLPIDLVGFIGNVVGALAVRIVGNRAPVEPVPLFKFVTALLK